MKITTFLCRNSSLPEMFVIITVAISVFGINVGLAVNCYNCRSKGVIGDCQDPFDLSENSTLMNSSRNGRIWNLIPIKSVP